MTTDIALITGAAGDIGSAVAAALATQARTLVLADHPSATEKLAAVAARLRELSSSVVELTFDVTSRSDTAAAFATCCSSVGIPNLIFNNAGYQGTFERVDLMKSTEVERVMMVNVVGVFNVMAEAAGHMIAAGIPGAIVNTGSMAGVSGAPNMAAYSASKAAVVGLTKSSAKDLAPHGIRVNAISPAFIGPGTMWERQVEMQAAANSQYYSPDPTEVAQQMIDMVPLRRFGSVTEVANVVAFLLSDAASYLIGVNIEISGGSS